MGMVLLIVVYCIDEDFLGIKLLIEEFLGYDKWWISLNLLGVFLGIMLMGEVWKLGKGGVLKGFIILLVLIFFFNFVNVMFGLCSVFCKLGDLKWEYLLM